jgi:hypothetical protein
MTRPASSQSGALCRTCHLKVEAIENIFHVEAMWDYVQLV